MRVVLILKYLFIAVGIALLVGAAFAYNKFKEFLRDALSIHEIIVSLAESRSSVSISYHSLIRFVSSHGRVVEFTSFSGGSASSYPVGSKFDVLYSSLNEDNAKVKSFFGLWGGVMVMSIMGSVFFAIGAMLFVLGRLRSRKKQFLKRSGIAVEAKIQSVQLNCNININGLNPFVISCQWLNPVTQHVHIFKSEDIWFDPSPYIEREVIKVLVEKDNPKGYYVDISFLPEWQVKARHCISHMEIL